MHQHVILFLIFAVYYAIVITYTAFLFRCSQKSDLFLIAGRSLSTTLILGLTSGLFISASSIVSASDRGYALGLMGSLPTLSISAALGIFALTLASRFRGLQAITVPEIIGRLFGPRMRLVTALIIALAYFIIGISQIKAGGALIASFISVDARLIELSIAGIIAFIIASGGLYAIASINIIQIVVIFVSMSVSLVGALVLVGGSLEGGILRLATELPLSTWRLTGFLPGGVVYGDIVSAVLTLCAAQAAITGILAARNERTAVYGTLLSALSMIPIGLMFALLGVCARVYFAGSLPEGLGATPSLMLALNPILGGIMLCGCLAAIISTGPLLFLAPIQIIIRDIYTVSINPTPTDREIILLHRILTIVLVTLAWIISVTGEKFLILIHWAFPLRIGIGIILLIAAYLGIRRVSSAGAYAGMAAGTAVYILWNHAHSPFGIHVVHPCTLAVLGVTLLVSKIFPRTNPVSPEVEDIFREMTWSARRARKRH